MGAVPSRPGAAPSGSIARVLGRAVVIRGSSRLLAPAAWLLMALCCLGLGLVGLDLLVLGVPLAGLCLATSWGYYGSHAVLEGSELRVRYARPGTRTIRRDAVSRLDEVAGGLTTRPVLVSNDGRRVVLDPAGELAGMRIFLVRQELSRWLGGDSVQL